MKRKIREAKSKVFGTKQVLTQMNQLAHSVTHELDTSIAGGGASGYVLFWNSNTFIRTGDVSNPIYVPEDGTIESVYVSTPLEAVADLTVDVYVNGVSIFTTLANRPKVLTGDQVSADAVPDERALVARDVVELEIVDAGGNYGRIIVYIVVT